MGPASGERLDEALGLAVFAPERIAEQYERVLTPLVGAGATVEAEPEVAR